MDTSELQKHVREALAEAASPAVFEAALHERGVQLEWSRRGDELVGLKFRPTGSSAWLKASSVGRDLSATRVVAALARNANTSAPERVRHEAELTAPQQPVAAPAPAPAAPPSLDFLGTPAPSSRDEPLPAAAPAKATEDEAAAARAGAEADLDAELRGLEMGELFDLANPRVEPVELTIARLLALVALITQILTFGLIRAANPSRAAARLALAPRAESEIQRRKLTPVGAAARRAALDLEVGALERRSVALRQRQVQRGDVDTRIDHTARSERARQEVEREHDARAPAGAPTFAGTRQTIDKVDAQIAALEHEGDERQAPPAPGLFSRIFGGGGSRDDATVAARAAAARQQRALKLAALEARRVALLAALNELWLAIRERVLARQAAAEAKAEAARALDLEAKQVEHALRVRVPEERRLIGAQIVQEAAERVVAREAAEREQRQQPQQPRGDAEGEGEDDDEAPRRTRHRG